jgi:hypothetical protein
VDRRALGGEGEVFPSGRLARPGRRERGILEHPLTGEVAPAAARKCEQGEQRLLGRSIRRGARTGAEPGGHQRFAVGRAGEGGEGRQGHGCFLVSRVARDVAAEPRKGRRVPTADVVEPREADREPLVLRPAALRLEHGALGDFVHAEIVEGRDQVGAKPWAGEILADGPQRPVERLVVAAQARAHVREIHHRREMARIQIDRLEIGQARRGRMTGETLEVAEREPALTQRRVHRDRPPRGGHTGVAEGGVHQVGVEHVSASEGGERERERAVPPHGLPQQVDAGQVLAAVNGAERHGSQVEGVGRGVRGGHPLEPTPLGRGERETQRRGDVPRHRTLRPGKIGLGTRMPARPHDAAGPPFHQTDVDLEAAVVEAHDAGEPQLGGRTGGVGPDQAERADPAQLPGELFGQGPGEVAARRGRGAVRERRDQQRSRLRRRR